MPSSLVPDLLVSSGLGTILYSTTRYYTVMRDLERNVFRPSLGAIVGLSTVVGTVGVGFLVNRRERLSKAKYLGEEGGM